MTNLIAKVAELRELAAKDIPGKYTSDCPEYDYMVGVLNAAPRLLAALGKVQAGDVNEIDYAIQELTRIFGPDNVAETIEVLHRYADLARLMEGNL